jgi:S-adenosylmethionine synthetase
VVVGGEIKSKAKVDIEKVVRDTIKRIGYDKPECGFNSSDVAVLMTVHEQSPDIAQGVEEGTGDFKDQGAGDQGLMFGYATNETESMLPLPIDLAHKLTMRLSGVRKSGQLPYLWPDGKSQVTVEYEDGKAKRVDTVVIAAHHAKGVDMERLRQEIKEHVVNPVVGNLVDMNTKYFINATGRFEFGGPPADTGLTGRKLIVDSYGGYGRHGGGAYSGKCITKVDRSASYMARHVAKNVVAAGLADECEVQVAYAIGVADPVSLHVNTFGTAKIPEERIEELIKKHFDLRPKAIIEYLDLKRPIYKKTANYGHFGRNDPDFSWERTDKADALRADAGMPPGTRSTDSKTEASADKPQESSESQSSESGTSESSSQWPPPAPPEEPSKPVSESTQTDHSERNAYITS